MKLEHLIQAYNFNKIPAKIKQKINQDEERAGVIQYSKDTYGSYLVDNDEIVIVLNLFINCIVANNKTMKNQISHTTETLIVIQKTIELLGNTKQSEANKILEQLGLFNGNIKAKAVRFNNYIYKIDVVGGLLLFSIIEELNNQKIQKIKSPPIKSTNKIRTKESGGVVSTK